MRSGAAGEGLASGTGSWARVGSPVSDDRDGVGKSVRPTVPVAAARSGVVGPPGERKLSILRTSSSAANGFRITSSDWTLAARSRTVPFTMPEMRSTGILERSGWLLTNAQIS